MCLDFEKVVELCDQVVILWWVQDQQSMEGGNGDVDIVVVIVIFGGVCVYLISVCGGWVLGSKNFFLQVVIEEEVGEVLLVFFGQYYFSYQECDLLVELIVNVMYEDFLVLVLVIVEV